MYVGQVVGAMPIHQLVLDGASARAVVAHLKQHPESINAR